MKWTRRQLLSLAAAPLAAQGPGVRNVRPQPCGKPSGILFDARLMDVAEEAGQFRRSFCRTRIAALAFAATLLFCAAADAEVDFARQVHPIFVKKCFACHSSAVKQGGLSVETIESLLEGGVHGPSLEPGAAEESLLYRRVAGIDEPRMPMGMSALADSEVAILRDWINEGARWEESPEGPLRATAPLAPREVAVPDGPDANPIDRFVARYRREKNLDEPDLVADRDFLRRAYLDLWGFVPPPEALDSFLRGSSNDRRDHVVDRLLEADDLYAEHWISFYNDLLRNDEGVVYHGGRESITDWLLSSLRENMPYDRMVRELLSPEGEGAPEGFLIGVNWRGTVNASQTPPMQAAQNSAQVFLGVNLKCGSCHDSFVNQWKLADSYGLAAFFAEGPLELVRCDAPTGQRTAIKFLFPSLGEADPFSSLAERRATAARLFTASENGRFARTLVNRYWKELTGRGLVEPADDMDQTPWEPDLLDWLAADFAGHGYDLKHLLRRIMTSRAYQTAAVSELSDSDSEYVFRGPLERRMSAEQFADSLSSITGEWSIRETNEAALWARDWRLKATPLGRAMGRPVRDQVFTERIERATTLQALELLSGETLTQRLRRGAQRLLGRLPEAPAPLWDSGITRAGQLRDFDLDVGAAKNLYLLIRDADSYDPTRVIAGWAEARLVKNREERELLGRSSPWRRGLELEGIKDPSAIAGPIPMQLAIPTKDASRFRGKAGVDESSRLSDINARVRFFIFDEEPHLDRLIIPRGPSPISYVPSPLSEDPEAAVDQLYLHALGRASTAEEKPAALALLRADDGEIPTEGLADLLWSLVLLPEFQVLR